MNIFCEKGNVLVYVLLAVILFGALGFTLSRQTQNSGISGLKTGKMEFYATQILDYSSQAKSVIDQMIITGSSLNNMDLTMPGETGFDTGEHIDQVFHPLGGGLEMKSLPESITLSSEPEDSGWYMSSSINVEWTNSDATDLILTAYQIKKPLCALLNKKITGSENIPILSGSMMNYFIDSKSNNSLDTDSCPDCEGYGTLCVSNSKETSYSFYSILAAR